MWPEHPFQKHFCILLLSLAIVATYYTLKTPTILQNIDLINSTMDDNLTWIHMEYYDPKVLNILGLFELTTKYGARSQSVEELQAAKLAIEHVNYYRIIPGYHLNLLVNDSKVPSNNLVIPRILLISHELQCDPGVGIDAFFHTIYSEKVRILMVLNGICSNVSESLAHVVPYWNILQISYGSTSPTLSDRKKFPLFYRTIPPESSHDYAKLAFVQHFNWSVVATFSQTKNTYLLPINNLMKRFETYNITCMATITFSPDNFREQLRILKESDVRVILASFAIDLAKKLFCHIHKLGMYDSDYVWILQDNGVKWWQKQYCMGHKMVGEGVFLFGQSASNQTDISGLDTKWRANYAGYAYDAIWSMALTMRETRKNLWYYLENFDYEKDELVCNFVKNMDNLQFIGSTGPIKFDGADRIGDTIIHQIQAGNLIQIAYYNSMKNQLDFNCLECQPIYWKYGIPVAKRIMKIQLIQIPSELIYIICIISSMGILLAFLFLLFNLHFRRVKSVKLSSPKLNNVAAIGCIFVYSSVILHNFNYCSVRVYLLASGFSLAFGAIFAKTYRVHRIFTYCPSKDRLLKDKQLIALILIPLLIDGIILILWVMIDPLQHQLHNMTVEYNLGIVHQPQVEVCCSRNTIGWYVAIYGYKGIILIMGVFMAWETRHVKVQALNDAQYVGICVYSAVFTALIVILTNLIEEYVILTYLARNLSILGSTTITLGLLFLPKLKNFNNSDPVSVGLKIESNTRRFASDDPRELIYRLEIQNKVYRCEVEALDKEIGRLERLLGDGVYTISGRIKPRSDPEFFVHNFSKSLYKTRSVEFFRTYEEKK